MFSSRLGRGLDRNRLSFAVEHRRASGLPIVDLTQSNPTRAGFDYPPDLLEPLGRPAGLTYAPSALGLPAARLAVSYDFARRGINVAPERIVLTASTSEAYSVLFKLLCDPGDVVLAPRPSYPLVEHLTDLDAIAVELYSLEFHSRWSIDLDGIRRRLDGSPAIRAIVLVSPNNPTGAVVTPSELTELASLASTYDVALIAD